MRNAFSSCGMHLTSIQVVYHLGLVALITYDYALLPLFPTCLREFPCDIPSVFRFPHNAEDLSERLWTD